jgi:ectoine/hydroxyectoine ABC transporter permease protein EhuD
VNGIFSLFDFGEAVQYVPDLLRAAVVSVELTLLIMALSLVLGLVVALARMSRIRTLRAISTLYVEVIRGTPCLLQLIYIYYVLPAFGIRFPAFTAGVIGLTINYAAYLSEVYRAGIQAVGKGQLEAAQALGMSRSLMMRLVVLPQAFRIILPPLGNFFISLFKDTALVSTITVRELLYEGQLLSISTFQYFSILTIVGAIYLGLCYPSSLAVRQLERRLKVGYRPRRGASLRTLAPERR